MPAQPDFLFDAGPRQTAAMPRKPKTSHLYHAPQLADQLVLSHGPSGLIVDDEGLLSRVVALHSADKAHFAHYYADIVGTGMRNKWEVWWVELFAGPGRVFVPDESRFVHGSPLSALDIRHPFNGYVFVDLDDDCVRCLRRRVGDRPNVHVLQGNANDADLHDRVAAIVPRDTLVVLYCDPEGLDLRYSTLEYFARRYQHLDLLLNFPVRGVIRALRAGHAHKAGQVLAHLAPAELIRGGNRQWGPSVREWFERQLQQLGYRHFASKLIQSHAKNADQYDLLLASRVPRAKKFFEEATRRDPGGQYTLSLGC